MATVCIRDGRFELDGRGIYPVGVNYAPRYVCTDFWADWREDVIRQDLDTIAQTGLNVVRIPVIWPTAEPEPGVYSEQFAAHLTQFVDWCGQRNLMVMPWFLAGVSTGNYDLPWRDGRGFLSGFMLDRAADHLRHWVAKYRNDPRILCWDICDEPEFYSQLPSTDPLPYSPAAVRHYTKTLADAIRSADDTHVITLGFCHICSEKWGIDVRDVAELLDVMSVTGYAYYVREPLDGLRNTYYISWMTRMQRQAGREVFLGESPGNTTVTNAEDVVANYLRISTLSSLAAGSMGVIPWVYTDYERDAHTRWPLEEGSAAETAFGLWRNDGTIKPSGEDLARLAKLAERLEWTEYRPAEKPQTAILTPDAYYDAMPGSFHASFMAYALARMADLTVDYLWERDCDERLGGYKLLLVPGCGRLRQSTWQRIEDWVRAGGTVLQTLGGAGGYGPSFQQMFGVSIRGGLPGPGATGARMTADWQQLSAGDVLSPLSDPRGVPLWRPAEDAELLAEYDDGRPLLIANRFGKGRTIACAHSLEASFFEGGAYGHWQEYPGWRIYRAAARDAGVMGQAETDNACVELHLMDRRDGADRLLMLLNHDDCRQTGAVCLARPAGRCEVVETRDGACTFGDKTLAFDLEPFEEAWVRLT